MRKGAFVIILLPSGVGTAENQTKYALRLVDEGCSLEIGILWPTSLQKMSSTEQNTSVAPLKYKLKKRGVVIEGAKIAGFTEGLSSARVFTIHSAETKGVTLLGFVCSANFHKENVGWSACGSMLV